jgi:hypothetical protein
MRNWKAQWRGVIAMGLKAAEIEKRTTEICSEDKNIWERQSQRLKRQTTNTEYREKRVQRTKIKTDRREKTFDKNIWSGLKTYREEVKIKGYSNNEL